MKTASLVLATVLMAGTASTQCAHDPILEAFIGETLASNPGLRAMGYRVQAARAALQKARSSRLPRFDVSASYTVTDNAPQAFMMTLNQRRLNMADPGFDFNAPDDTDNVRLSVGVKHRLIDPARDARVRQADAGSRITLAQEQALRNALIHEVTRGYYRVLEAQAFVAVQTAALASLEESLRVAGERFAEGSAVKTDVLNLEVQTAQARENLIRARNGVQLAIAAFNTIVGNDVVSDKGLDTPALQPIAPEALQATPSAVTRPELQAASLRIEAASWGYQASRRDRLPVVSAFGQHDWDSDDLSDPESSYTAGAMLEWEWFSGFEKQAARDEADQLLQAAEAEYERVKRELSLDLRQAQLGLEEGWARLQVTSQAVSSAEEALRITRARYREGAAEVAVLLVAELGLTETRMRNTAAIYDYQIAASNLNRALGTLVQRY